MPVSRSTERIEPLAPVQLEAYRKGDLLSRMVADVDALQNLHLRVVGPPMVALVAGAVAIGVAAAFVPWAALVLTAGLLFGGIAVPAVSGSLSRRTGGRQAAARGELTAELVEVLDAAPELAVYGREGDSLDRVRAADAELVRLARRDALAGGVGDAAHVARRRPDGRRRPRVRDLGACRWESRQDDDRDDRPPRPRVVRSGPATFRGGTGAVRDPRGGSTAAHAHGS